MKKLIDYIGKAFYLVVFAPVFILVNICVDLYIFGLQTYYRWRSRI